MVEKFHDSKEEIDIVIDPQKINNDIGKEIREIKSEELNKIVKQNSVESSPKSVRSKEYEIDFDYLVFNDDSESDEETEDEHGVPIQRWSKTKKHRLQKCLWKLKYNRIISSFYLNDLKKQEEKFSWWIIVISTITSGLTVANNVENIPFKNYDIYINTALTLSSMGTSLIAAWIKKQQFVERINEVDKYLININSLCEEIDVQFMLLEKDRIPYKEFKEKYIPQITNYVSSNPMIPPESWKKCVKEITLKYPQLIEPDNNDENKLWPWFGDMVEVTDQHGDSKLVRKPTKFMKYMLKKDKKTRLKSSCCFDVEEKNSVYQ